MKKSITLNREDWVKIASACIYVADWIECDLPEDIRTTLRKTYYQIKNELEEE